jgi:hypothetical protein
MRRRHSTLARSRVRVLLGGTLNAAKCQQIYHATCSSQVLTWSMGIDLLYGSTANELPNWLLRQENHPPPLSWTLVCCYPTPTSSQPSRRAINILIEEGLVLFAPRREERRDQYRDIAGHRQVEIRQQHKVNMSADRYLMQEELGSTLEQSRQDTCASMLTYHRWLIRHRIPRA